MGNARLMDMKEGCCHGNATLDGARIRPRDPDIYCVCDGISDVSAPAGKEKHVKRAHPQRHKIK